ncbi:metal-dependent phosphohydrolase domain-containing protein [Rhizobium phage RHph_N17]|nr:metal-dependent phosphohydrolase domain-containing protein [Rhizobium phage RHph_N17]
MRLTTYTGTEFVPSDPIAADVHPLDIIHPLSMQCRYGGHVKRFYSVAEHCVHLSRVVSPKNALWALLHDASEAYIVDIPAPVKVLLPEYLGIEAKIMAVVCERFGLPLEMPDEVREADIRIRSDEGLFLINGEHPWIVPQDAFGVELGCWAPAHARMVFMSRLRELWDGWSDDFSLLP